MKKVKSKSHKKNIQSLKYNHWKSAVSRADMRKRQRGMKENSDVHKLQNTSNS